ncbi:MAG: hypothetical protein ACRD32_01420, partial [Nitrososphaerales archaeon]
AHNYAMVEDLKIATGRFQITGGTGNQVITGVGFQPKAYILFLTTGNTDDSETVDSRFSVGMTDGVRQFCMSSGDEDGEAGGDVGRRMSTSHVLCSSDIQADQINEGNATHNSLNADGFTINKLTAFSHPTTPLVNYIAFGGSELNARVDTVNLANAIGSPVDVTSPNFQPDLVFTSYIGNNENTDVVPGDTDNDLNSFSFGWAINPSIQAANNQYSVLIGSIDGANPSDTYTNMSNKYSGLSLSTGGAADTAYDINSFDSQGFSVTTRTSGASDSNPTEHMGYLALDFGNNPKIYSVNTTARTTTGAIPYTGSGFKPTFLFGIGSAVTQSFNTATAGGSIAIGITNGTHTNALEEWTQDNVATTNSGSRVTNTQFWSANQQSGTIEYEATFTSFDSNGWTLNYGDAATGGTTYRQVFLAIRAAGTNNAIMMPDAAVPGMNIAVQIIGSKFSDTDVVTTNSSQIVVGPIVVSNSNGAKVASGGTVMQTTLFINGTATPGPVEVLINNVPIRYPFNIVDRSDHFIGTGDFTGKTNSFTVTSSPQQSADDAEEIIATGNVDINSSDLEMVLDSPDNQWIGIRFPNIQVPKGSTITSASIQFTDDGDGGNDNTPALTLSIRGQAADNAAIFTTAGNPNFDISGRTRTAAKVNWVPPNTWGVAGTAGPDQKTPDIKTVIQEVINRAGWGEGNSIVIIINGTANAARVAETWNKAGGTPAVLSVSYETKIFTLGDDTGINGNRTLAGTIVLDSLIIPSGYTVQIDTTDIDTNLSGIQGYLPAIIVVDGPVDIQGVLNINGTNGQSVTTDTGGVGGNGGPGGGGGGGGAGDETGTGGDGGDGYTGGGGGGCENDVCAGTNGGDGGDGTAALGSASSGTGSDDGGNGGIGLIGSNTAGGGGAGDASDNYFGGGGGTGFWFGSGGGGGTIAGDGAGGNGGGGGAGGGAQQADGAGGGFGTNGGNADGNLGSTHGATHLLPIAGGSGGAGGTSDEAGGNDDGSGGGGGGGGALLIYSNNDFTSSGAGVIDADGGNGGNRASGDGGYGGGGSGGGIILQSRHVTLTATSLSALGGTVATTGDGGEGRVRVDGLTGTNIPGALTSEFIGPSIVGVNSTHINGTGTSGNGVITLKVNNAGTFTTYANFNVVNGKFQIPVSLNDGANYITAI